jgi:tetratricopeptide (TPR) repeat protein
VATPSLGRTLVPIGEMVGKMNLPRKVLGVASPLKKQSLAVLVAVIGVLTSFSCGTIFAQGTSLPQGETNTVQGTIRSSTGDLLTGVIVRLEEKEPPNSLETKTKADGSFVFSGLRPGIYTVSAKKAGWREGVSDPLVLRTGEKKRVDLVLKSLPMDHPRVSGASRSSSPAAGEMEFTDQPNFTVAGVMDWNNTGTHGSDVRVRTSEALAKEALALKNGGLVKGSTVESNAEAASLNAGESRKKLLAAREQARTMLAKGDTADGHRLLGELNERLGAPLEAVQEYERAARMDPSEQNYFEWGTELLLHRGDEAAVEVFAKGSHAHPDSARMLAGLGVALYAGGKSEEAARQLCTASDLKPADPAPYIFLGKIVKSETGVLACAEQKLARFVQEHPGNALANYYYGVILWKRDRGSENPAGLQKAEALLEKAASIDPELAEAYLQLGILHSERANFEQAIRDYKKAIEVSPQLSEAHYRLGSAYRRIDEESKAEQEFQEYEKIEKAETVAIESQRRELRQFLIILKDQPAAAPR